jgi:hypothetical protein
MVKINCDEITRGNLMILSSSPKLVMDGGQRKSLWRESLSLED